MDTDKEQSLLCGSTNHCPCEPATQKSMVRLRMSFINREEEQGAKNGFKRRLVIAILHTRV
jgi:hypothetical protein